MAHEISSSDDVIDIRNVIERFEELEDTRGTEFEDDDLEETREEFDRLRKLLEECKGQGGDHQWRGDWYPVTLIAESYFEDYARETASDLYGKEIDDAHWPFDCIDWEKAADALRMDYTSVDFDGETYLTR